MLRERGNPQKGALFVSPKGQRLSVRFINEAMKKPAKKAYPDKEFKTKSLRSAYNSALLRANIQPQELKDIMMGHKRAGARGHYAYDKITILEAYEKAFKYLTINSGTQTKKDLERIETTIQVLSEQIAKLKAELEQEKDDRAMDTMRLFRALHKFMAEKGIPHELEEDLTKEEKQKLEEEES